jgi:hypothetical protein
VGTIRAKRRRILRNGHSVTGTENGNSTLVLSRNLRILKCNHATTRKPGNKETLLTD